ncbi:PDZ domain-containing protein [Corynebacterium sp. 4HC-13]|uniref:PDZ domain-containing protein n=2 Tax=Corynebacterium anserum TaxID=2684406 RepID=A0A7G7YR83_9CORY|nr:PDZ domain-containing protein [Corynebacterium anserum]QNH97003.1 PDZ domain-containing protein [Corynebacterium anserum]
MNEGANDQNSRNLQWNKHSSDSVYPDSHGAQRGNVPGQQTPQIGPNAGQGTVPNNAQTPPQKSNGQKPPQNNNAQTPPQNSYVQPQSPHSDGALNPGQATPAGQDGVAYDHNGNPLQPQGEGKTSKRWSTPAVAALLLVGVVVASATTTVVMNHGNDSSVISENATTSFDTKSDNAEAKAVQPGSTEDVAKRVLPSVVSIKVESGRSSGEGSGSVFSSDGLIVTNNHVVSGAERGGNIQVVLYDGRTLKARVVATDPQTDIAVIKAEGVSDLQPIQLGDSDALNVGEDVVAVGSPLGLASTVTTGIVSAKNRPVQASGEDGGEASLIDAIQTDAAINPGNSGGALVDMEGKLVGIPSVIATMGGSMGQQSGSIGLGFAIPVNQAQRIVQELIDKGKAEHPIIGAKVNTASDVIGAEIVDVSDGSPAADAGLKRGDVVVKVNDRPVDSGVGLIAAIRSHKVGDKVSLAVRDGENGPERTVEMTLAAE